MKTVVLKPEGGSGMFSYIWQVLRGIVHNPNKKYYIDFSTSIYNDSCAGKSNAWEYYFEQLEEKPDYQNIEKVVGNIEHPDSEYRFTYLKNPTEEQITNIRVKYNKIIHQYFKLLPHVTKLINDFYDSNFKGYKVLGVHLRGTDHPEKGNMNDYIKIINDKISNYDRVFVASDDAQRYAIVKETFGEKVITRNSIKSQNTLPLHHSIQAPIYQYTIGEDVIIDAYLLSKVDYLCCFSNSNVNFFSRCLNPKLEYSAYPNVDNSN